MATHNQNQLIARSLNAIYPMYSLGALYLVYPVLGWYLLAQVAVKRLRGDSVALHPLIICWLIGMLGMLIVLIIGHIDWQLGSTATLKSSIGWAKGWALIAVFLAAGTLLTDRSQLVRAVCTVGKWTVFLTPLLVVASVVRLPEVLFVSPLKVFGGSTAEYFSIALYEPDPGFGVSRFRYFAPWAPAIGLIGNLLLLISTQEKNTHMRRFGMTGAVLMIVLSLSRLGWVVALVVPCALLALASWRSNWLWILSALGATLFAVFGHDLILLATDGYEALKGARSESSLVRGYLADIALSRWWQEAPVWGHGRVEAGPHLVQYMMIGSHHTWLGLLFVKGVLGVVALAVPLLATLLVLLRHAFVDAEARVAFGCIAILSMYSLGENLEILVYLYWPALVYTGSVLQDRMLAHD